MLTQKRLRELLDYNTETGEFTRKVRAANCAAGTIAGCLRPSGYVVISVDDKLYRAHYLAWLWMTGAWPKKFMDHKDLNKSNNRWGNLREATKSQNAANRPPQANSKSQLKGAYYYKAYDRWQSTITKDRRTIYLGYFDTAEQAHAAYCKAAQEIYGEFARSA